MSEHQPDQPDQPGSRPDGRPGTRFLAVDGGTLAYEVSGSGRLVLLAHGIGDDRRAYRLLAPALVAAGYRVAVTDLRGAGESSTGWDSYSRTAIAGDLLALVEHLTEAPGDRCVLVGHSIAGGAVTIAAATAPHLVAAVVELAPFTRRQSLSLGDLRSSAYRRAATHLLGALLGSSAAWGRYLETAYPVTDLGGRPVDHDARKAEIMTMLGQPGRTAAMQAMFRSAPTDAGDQLPHVRCPVLVIQGEADPDWADPRAEGAAVVAELPPGVGRLEVVPGSGHYPHVQHPTQVLALVLPFLDSVTGREPTVA